MKTIILKPIVESKSQRLFQFVLNSFDRFLFTVLIFFYTAFSVSATPGEALYFGSGNLVNCGNSLGNFGTGSFTIETWFNTTSVNKSLFSKRPSCGHGNFWSIRVNNTGNITFEVDQNASALNYLQIITPLSYNDGNWHHLACRRDGLSLSIFMDGNLVISGNTADTTNLNNAAMFMIGNSPCSGFLGKMDETRIWNTALTDCEIFSKRNCEIPGIYTDLLANYHYNQGVANSINTTIDTLIDFSGNSYTGTLIGFNLIGPGSNWVDSGSVVSGYACTGGIVVTGNGANIVDGANTASTSNFTDFANVSTAGTSTRVFSVQNTGSSDLILDSINFSNITAGGYYVVSGISFPHIIPPSSTSNFTVSSIPQTPGVKTAKLNIYNNDCIYPVFDFTIRNNSFQSNVLNFDGIDDRINCSTSPLLDISEGSWEAWVKTTTLSVSQYIFYKQSTNSNSALNYGLSYDAVSGKFKAEVKVGTTQYAALSTTAPAANTWYHVAATYTSGSLKIYVNGVLQNTTNTPAAPCNSGTGHLGIGGPLSVNTNPWNGYMDEVRLWNKALSFCELNHYMNCSSMNSAPGLLINYHFSDGIGASINTGFTSVQDTSGNNLDGLLTNFARTGTGSNWLTGAYSGIGSCIAYTPIPPINITIPTCGPTYTWAGNTYASPGVYVITFITAAGCDSVVNLTLINNIITYPVASLSASSYYVCGGSEVEFTASGGSSYTFYTTEVNFNLDNNFSTGGSSKQIQFLKGGTCYVVAVDTNGCRDTASVEIMMDTDCGYYAVSAYSYIPPDSTYITLPPSDDGSTLINLPFAFKFGNLQDSSIYINMNGNITFSASHYGYATSELPLQSNIGPAIFAYWADVDTRIGNRLKYKIDPHKIIVSWNKVGRYYMDTSSKNTFQIILSDGTDSLIGVGNNVGIRYGDIQWTSGIAIPGNSAIVGIDVGDSLTARQLGSFDIFNRDKLDSMSFAFDLSNTRHASHIYTGNHLNDTMIIRYGDADSLVRIFHSPDTNQFVTSVFTQSPALCNPIATNTSGDSSVAKLVINNATCALGTYTSYLTASDQKYFLPLSNSYSFNTIIKRNLLLSIQTPINCINSNSGTISATIVPAAAYTFKLNNSTNTTGIFNGLSAGTYTVRATAGTDTIYKSITLNPEPVFTGIHTVTACNSYTWFGVTYTSSNNTATHLYTTAAGCDSMVTLNLTINYSNSSTHTVTACNSYTWFGVTYTSSNNTATHLYTTAAGCDSVVTLNLTINYSNASTQTATAMYAYIWPATGQTYYNTGNYSAFFTNAVGCDSTATLALTILPILCPVNVHLWLQGYYTSNSDLTPALSNQGVGFNTTESDSITIALYHPVTLQMVEWHKTILYTNGNAAADFMQAIPGQSYYLVIRHRNSIETWSAQPLILTPNLTYDFSQAAGQAYGNNQVQVAPGVFALYSGDIDQSGGIDGDDFNLLDPDIQTGNGGYLSTDLDGSGGVDGDDFNIFDPNAQSGVGAFVP